MHIENKIMILNYPHMPSPWIIMGINNHIFANCRVLNSTVAKVNSLKMVEWQPNNNLIDTQ